MKPRPRAAAIILRGGAVLLMHRIRPERDYFVLPGGGLEPGENYEEACCREVREETGLEVIALEAAFSMDNLGNEEHYFWVQVAPGQPRLGGPELDKNSPQDVYRLEWIQLEALAAMNLLPEQALAFIRTRRRS